MTSKAPPAGYVKGGCGRHRPYRTKAEAEARVGWHLRCDKCATVGPLRAWVCLPSRQHWHCGHRAQESTTHDRY